MPKGPHDLMDLGAVYDTETQAFAHVSHFGALKTSSVIPVGGLVLPACTDVKLRLSSVSTTNLLATGEIEYLQIKI